MARLVEEREDLLRDASALVPRIELHTSIHGQRCEVFAGFRKENALSLYFDTEPVYHFNSRGELRRAFVDGQLIKAQEGKLVVWQPRRTSDITEMMSHQCDDQQHQQFCAKLLGYLQEFNEALDSDNFTVAGQVPADADALLRLRQWLDEVSQIAIADSPHVK